ncbi:hypothetical protein [Thomasclavelia cocleata]|uniref:hypothetical protein n=1 Tax=Thomasclavelia cocleata TaxID=69824 RepID=UPI00242BB664|nr:hypothetical protein [Thomasclavelia cocleata]
MVRKRSFLYKNVKSRFKSKYKSDIFQNPFVGKLLLGLFVLCDYLVIRDALVKYSMLDKITRIVISLVFAGILDISLYFVGNDLAGAKFEKFKDIIKNKMNIILIFIFILFFSGYFAIRMSSLYDQNESNVDYGEDTVEELTFAQIVVGTVLAVFPLGTSALAFRVGYISPEQKEAVYLKKLELDAILVKERIKDLYLCNDELVKSLEIDINDFDNRLFENAIAKVDETNMNLDLYARKLLARKINSPEAVTILLQKSSNGN